MVYIEKLLKIRKTLADTVRVKLNIFRKNCLLINYLFEHYIYGVTLIEYDQYEFYWKSRHERRRYVCYREFEKIIKISNDKKDYKYFDNKPLFNKTFAEFLGRKWIDTTNCTLKNFKDFLKQNEKLFVKPVDGMCGRGAYILYRSKIIDANEMFEQLVSEQAIVEQVVDQHQALAEFNSSSVNTLRIVTMLCADDTVKIMAAVIRLGRIGQVVDNFHNYGVVALIDIETGIIKTTGIDRDFNRFVVHPDSGKVIPGFLIPSWEKIVQVVERAAKIIPTVRYVGWDIAVGKNGEVIMIEGNKSADHDVTQVADQVGKWPQYKEIINQLKGKKNEKNTRNWLSY